MSPGQTGCIHMIDPHTCTCTCNCTHAKKAATTFYPLIVPNLLPSVGAVSRSNGTKRSCARLTRSQPSHPRRAGAPRRPGRPAPVAVRAPQHPARQTCFDTSWLPSRAPSSEVPAQPLEFHSLQGSPIEALRRAVDDEPRTSRAARLRPRICDRSGWHPPALDHIRIAQHTFGEVTNTEA